MRVAELSTVAVALPFREPYGTARGRLEQREMVVVRLVTDAGVTGLGEAVPLALRGGTLDEVMRSLRKAERRLERVELGAMEADDPFGAAVDSVVEVTAGRRLAAPAAAAVEMALFDLAGKLAGEPLWRLLRAGSAEPVRCNATLVAAPPAAVADEARSWWDEGFRTFKLKLGTGADLEQVRAVREALGDEARIRIDANGTWTLADAEAILARLAPLGIELAEEPVSGLRDLARLRARTDVRIAADESVASPKQAQKAVEAGACELATVKLAKVGGIGAAAGVAEALPVYLSSALDGPLGIAAAAHAIQGLERVRRGCGLDHGLATQRLFADSYAARECELDGPLLRLPEGPGLGVELDAEALARLAL